LVGVGADRLARRRPPMVVWRRVALACLVTAATFVLVGANLPTPTLAIVALGISTACLVTDEAALWIVVGRMTASHRGVTERPAGPEASTGPEAEEPARDTDTVADGPSPADRCWRGRGLGTILSAPRLRFLSRYQLRRARMSGFS
jgi:hypothetical protein